MLTTLVVLTLVGYALLVVLLFVIPFDKLTTRGFRKAAFGVVGFAMVMVVVSTAAVNEANQQGQVKTVTGSK